MVFNNPAAVVGINATDDDVPDLEAPPGNMEVDVPTVTSNDEMNMNTAENIKIVVLDGIVMGPQINIFQIII